MGPRNAIENLIHSYAERIDRGDLEGVAELFAHGEITNEGIEQVNRGRDEVLQMYRSATRIYPETGTPRTRHVTTNVIVELSDDETSARTRAYFTVFQQTDSLPLQPIIAGRYHDRFECVDGRWRFAARHIICDLFGDLSQHLLFDAQALSS